MATFWEKILVLASNGRKKVLPAGDYISPNVLGSGTPDATTFLRGDGAWVAAGGAGAWVFMSELSTTTANGSSSMQSITPGANKILCIETTYRARKDATRAAGAKRYTIVSTDGSGVPTIVGDNTMGAPIDATGNSVACVWTVQGTSVELSVSSLGIQTITWYTSVQYMIN